MSTPFVGEVRLVGFNFAPVGWLFCAGQTLSIANFTTLFQLIGTTYGGDGQTTFNAPDLQGRLPIHVGSNGVNNYVLGQSGGAESVTLGLPQMPAHTHSLFASSNSSGGSANPSGNVVGGGANVFSNVAPGAAMNAAAVSQVGNSQPHENRQPYLTMNWIIATEGIFPSA